jgi:hypothetical protein
MRPEKGPKKIFGPLAEVVSQVRGREKSYTSKREHNMATNWHHAKGNQQLGPVTDESIRGLIANGQLSPSDKVWRDGMPQWVEASAVPELASAFPSALRPSSPPPLSAAPPVNQSASGTKVLVLTIIAGFFSIFIGGCTAAVGEGLSDLDQKWGDGRDSARMKRDSDNQIGFALLQSLCGVIGGVWAFRKYNDNTQVAIAGRRFKKLTLAGILILFAAALSITNAITFITAGVMNAIAGALVLMRAKSVGS